jgi:hypothetical protein
MSTNGRATLQLVLSSLICLAAACAPDESDVMAEVGSTEAALSGCGPACESLCHTKQTMCLDRCEWADWKCTLSCTSKFNSCIKGCQCPAFCTSDGQCPPGSVCHFGTCARPCNTNLDCGWCSALYGTCACFQHRCAAY